jgi:hypothetical protein
MEKIEFEDEFEFEKKLEITKGSDADAASFYGDGTRRQRIIHGLGATFTGGSSSHPRKLPALPWLDRPGQGVKA